MTEAGGSGAIPVIENKFFGRIPVIQHNKYFGSSGTMGEYTNNFNHKKNGIFHKNERDLRDSKPFGLFEINEESSDTSGTFDCDLSYSEEIEAMRLRNYGMNRRSALDYDVDDEKSCISSGSTVSQLTTTTASSFSSCALFSFDRMTHNKSEEISCRLRARELLGDAFYHEKNKSMVEDNVHHTEESKERKNSVMERLNTKSGFNSEVSKTVNFGTSQGNLNERQLDQYITSNKEILPELEDLMSDNDEILMDVTSRMLLRRRALAEIKSSSYTSENSKEFSDLMETEVLEMMGNIHRENSDNNKALQAFSKALNLRKKTFESNKNSLKTFAHTAIKMGILLEEEGRYEEAKDRYIEGLEKLEKISALSYLDTACTYRHLAFVYSKLGEDEAAMMTYKQALLIFEQNEDDLHKRRSVWKEYALALCNMGLLYHQREKTDHAILLYEKELEVLTNYGDRDYKIEAEIYHRIGLVYRDAEMYEKSIEYHLKELDISLEMSDFQRVLTAKRCLGDCYYFAEFNTEGIEMYKDIIKSINHKEKVSILNKLSILFGRQGGYIEALQCCIEACSLCTMNDTFDNKVVVMTFNNLGNIYSALDEIEKALECYNRALELHEKAQDDNSGDNESGSGMLYNIGILHLKMGSLKHADEYFKKFLLNLTTIDVANIQNREKNIKITKALNNMGNIRSQSGDYEAAINFYQDSLELKIILHGEGSEETFGTRCNLGTAYFETGQHDQAHSIFAKLLFGMEKAGSNELVKARVLNKLGNVSMATKSYQSALTYYMRALEIKTNVLLDENHEEILITRHNIALVLCQEKKYEEALSLLLEVKERQTMKVGEYDPLIAKITLDIANVYLSVEKLEEAESNCLSAMKALNLAQAATNDPCLRYSQKTFKKIIAMKSTKPTKAEKNKYKLHTRLDRKGFETNKSMFLKRW